MLTLPADTLGTPPGNSRRELLAFAATAFAVWLAGCAAVTAIHFLT